MHIRGKVSTSRTAGRPHAYSGTIVIQAGETASVQGKLDLGFEIQHPFGEEGADMVMTLQREKQELVKVHGGTFSQEFQAMSSAHQFLTQVVVDQLIIAIGHLQETERFALTLAASLAARVRKGVRVSDSGVVVNKDFALDLNPAQQAAFSELLAA